MTADQIAASCRDHAKALRAEADRLEDVANILAPAPIRKKKPPPVPPEVVQAEKDADAAIAGAQARGEELRLNVLSSTHPTARELHDRNLVYAS